MRESTIEQYLVREAARRGGKAWKWAAPGQRGVPDRIVCMPDWGKPLFVECKAPGKTLRPLQEHTAAILAQYGHTVQVVDSKHAVDRLWDLLL